MQLLGTRITEMCSCVVGTPYTRFALHMTCLLQTVLHAFLQDHLPEDAHLRCKDQAYVAVTKITPIARPVLVSEFIDRPDLIQALMTSCHIPFWLDGSPFTG